MSFPAKHAHLIGIGGVGMSGVARMLMMEGIGVSGSDMKDGDTAGLLREMGAEVFSMHDASNIPAHADAVIISAAIKDGNPELAEAGRRGLAVMKYAQALGLLMREKTGVAVSGTHGKTTTTAMIATVLTNAGLDPSFVVGGHVPGLDTSSREGAGEVFVAEACEYDRSFLCLAPRIAVVTNIEEDHLDYYSGLDEIVGAFKDFVSLVPDDGLLVANADDASTAAIREACPGRTETFGLEIPADWRAERLSFKGGVGSFDVAGPAGPLGRVELRVPGAHNVSNALAAAAVCTEVGVSFDVFGRSLGEFTGAARRFEVLGRPRGVTVVDDYAHHPTEIRGTLKAAREAAGEGRLWVVFQPHQYSRTRFFLKDFAESFSSADKVIVPDIYFVRDSEAERVAVNAGDLVRELVKRGRDAEYIPDWGQIVDRVSSEAAPGDMVITMGAGNINEVAHDLIRRLR